MAAPMKIRYPSGIPLDDLDVGQRYRFDLRSATAPAMIGDLREIVLRRRRSPSLVVMPVGAAHQQTLVIHKIAKISLAEVDLSNSPYEDDGDAAGGA